MPAATRIVGSLASFGATIALALYHPDTAFAVLAAVVLCLAVVPFVRIDLTPWLVSPPLAALALWSFSAPGAYVVALAVMTLVSALYVAVLVVRLTALHSRLPVTTAVRRTWLGSIVAGVLTATVAASALPLDLRFRLSEDAMNEVAREVLGGERDPETIERIGLWNVRDVRRVAGGVRFTVRDAGFLSSTGFTYQPDGRPPYDGIDSFRHYEGLWFIWTGGST